MRLAPKRILSAVLVSFLLTFSTCIFAQDTGNVLINSNPQGSLVRLRGDLTFSGVTPVKFDRAVSGQYRVEITREGYETYRSTQYFSESQFSQLDIRLEPKKRVKALFRSLVIPGWGQKYYGNNTKAFIFAFSAVASAVGYAAVRGDYDSKVGDFNDKKAAYNAATRWTDLPRLQAELYDAQKKANDAEDVVNVMAAVTAGIYVLNVLDALLLFPDYVSFTEYKVITARPEMSPGYAGMAVSIKF